LRHQFGQRTPALRVGELAQHAIRLVQGNQHCRMATRGALRRLSARLASPPRVPAARV
jgi:hypothetical protein